MPDADPMYLRKRLSTQLQVARKKAGYSQPDVADEMVWSLSKVMRLESGRTKISVTDLRALITFYGVPDETAAELIAHAQEARRQPWWQEYRNILSEGFKSYLGYEASASIVRNYEVLFVPGLLQTEEYARAILARSVVPEKEELLELRLRRQERLLQSSTGTELRFLIDEAALRRVIGTPSVTRAQIEHLREIAQLKHVQIGIIPLGAGLYPLLRSPYVIFEFPSAEQDRVVYLENPDGSVILRDKATTGVHRSVEDYLEAFWEVENEYATPITEFQLQHDPV
ncbi:helix-turn-helix domain-containing protein [Streptomyces sp. BH-SS-21]|uniref:Helix-turn-helix domain-containing protein n=1 Tax=Streptomyces liliiviolaceus TaxID=2823109 RepID=A0A940Y3V4_9ACTN|nr:helix-turn-helix transcriptional regulator [Streptomyces liliiviolaceus]MBQ0854825.1 helix-turn-helix domain-containing protein [Streptomyces liliiviolaceus]